MTILRATKFVPWLKPLIEKFMEADFYNILSQKVTELGSSCPSSTILLDGPAKIDRFTLVVPYAEVEHRWRFACNWSDEMLPPVILEFEGDLEFDPSYADAPEWNPKDPNTLVALVNWLLEKYREYQFTLAESFDASREVLGAMMCERPDLRDTFEVKVFKTGNRAGDIVFVASVMSELIQTLPSPVIEDAKKETPRIDDISAFDEEMVVTVVYRDYGAFGGQAEVRLSPFLNVLLGRGKALKVPPFDQETLLHHYIRDVQEMLDNEVALILEDFTRRRKLVSAILAYYEQGEVVSFDKNLFRSVSLLLEIEHFQYMVEIMIPVEFPAPEIGDVTFTVSSVYHEHESKGKQGESPLKMPYRFRPERVSAPVRWNVERMVKNLSSAIEKTGRKFKQVSVTQGT